MNFKEIFTNNNLLQSPYDSRDYKLKDLIPLKAVNIPEAYEAPKTPFIYNQGKSSQCASCAYNTVRYLQEYDIDNNGSGITEPFSTSFNYGNRIDGEVFEGMYLRSICKKGIDGSIPWSVFPGFFSVSKSIDEVNNHRDQWMEMAKPFSISSYYQCTDRRSVQTAILETGAVILGINVFDSFYRCNGDGYINYNPETDLYNYGGHAVTLVGWFNDNGKLYWIIQNSWGKGFGDEHDQGRAYLPEDYPWMESPWAVVDTDIEEKWEDYKKKYNIQ